MLAIAISLAIMLGFQYLVAPHLPQPPAQAQTEAAKTRPADTAAAGTPAPVAAPAAAPVPREVPRAVIEGGRIKGSVSLLGGRIDDIVLTGYREKIDPGSPHVRLLEPRSEAKPYYIQYGWTAAPGQTVRLPDNDTVWAASGPALAKDKPLTLSWDNGQGLTFRVALTIDDNYLLGVRQSVANATDKPVKLFPWSRVRRDYKPEVLGYYILFEGLLGVVDGTLKEVTYDSAKSDGEKKKGIAYEAPTTGGWIGITDKYWLAALIPDQAVANRVYFRHIDDKGDRYQVDTVTQEPREVAPGAEDALSSHAFVGAKEVLLLDAYQDALKLPHFDKAVDFGWFYFLTKPIFFAINWFNHLLGNFGIAILVFTVIVKAVFFPLANYSYRSMSKMKLLAPRMQEMRERMKDNPQEMQREMMAMYRAEKVNPASGCLPMLVQIPVFFALYKVLFVTIEMRQAPFYGWIHDLSAVDPTNVFNLFGLIPFDPTTLPLFGPFLSMGAWPLLMGVTMFLQQKLNPPPPDPVQAKLFQFMPIMFTFMLAGFPAGLVIYWSWNNLLSIAQQWLIMRQTSLDKPKNT
jgi:YidC/Oxa1 family membrane protein insertase